MYDVSCGEFLKTYEMIREKTKVSEPKMNSFKSRQSQRLTPDPGLIF